VILSTVLRDTNLSRKPLYSTSFAMGRSLGASPRSSTALTGTEPPRWPPETQQLRLRGADTHQANNTGRWATTRGLRADQRSLPTTEAELQSRQGRSGERWRKRVSRVRVKASRAHRSIARYDGPLGENPHRAGHERPEGAAVFCSGANASAAAGGR
jgi:hypothetical protein